MLLELARYLHINLVLLRNYEDMKTVEYHSAIKENKIKWGGLIFVLIGCVEIIERAVIIK